MTNYYVQSVEAELPKGARYQQIFGIILQLFALGLIAGAVFYSLYFIIPIVLLFLAGSYLTQNFYSYPRKFDYAFNDVRLQVVKTNLTAKTKVVANIPFANIKEFATFSSFTVRGDIIATSEISSTDSCIIVFVDGDKEQRLIFEPDLYLTMLLKEKLTEIGKKDVIKIYDTSVEE